jgi:ubiquinone/menaquinone biosynthesis C-methylase UbiE
MRRGAYYKDKLSASKLLKCYEVANPRIKQYLEAEIQFVISNIRNAKLVLELGCGYGRVMRIVSPFVSTIVGVDISRASLELANTYMKTCGNHRIAQMDASNMAFSPCVFDAVFCIQNGISAFGVDRKHLIAESIRVTKDDGLILFSSYSPKIWQERLDWFRKQSQLGLLGEIDEEATRSGNIVCKDGFTASTVSGDQFIELFHEFGVKTSIIEVDESSIFCKVIKRKTDV